MATIKTEKLSGESSPPPQDDSSSGAQTSPVSPGAPIPSFIQAADGGLVAGCIVPAGTVFGPYRGGIRKLCPRNEEDRSQEAEPTGAKLLKLVST